MAMLTIGGAAMPAPVKLTVSIEEIGDDSARNVLGQRLVDRLAVKRELELEWTHLSAAQAAALMAAVTQTVFFTAVYPDPETGAPRTAVCRATQRKTDVTRVENGSVCWADVSMKWEEQ